MLQVFGDNMPGPNQLSKLRQDVEVTADDLLRVPEVCSRLSLTGRQSPLMHGGTVFIPAATSCSSLRSLVV